MAEYNKVYASLKPELPKVIQQEQIYVYAPRSSRAGMKSISGFNITAPVSSVQYDTTDGITVTGNSSLVSEEVSGETATQNFQSEFKIPIRPGEYIKIDATADNDAVEVKVDDTALALDYWKIQKTQINTVPVWDAHRGTQNCAVITSKETPETLAYRDSNGNSAFRKVKVDRLATTTGEYDMPLQAPYYGGFSNGFTIGKTPTDTGTLTAVLLDKIKLYPNAGLKYNDQSYIRMDPTNSPDGTLNFIHIDGIDDGNGGYKATGKCFSITVSTREWKVVDLEFGGSNSGIEQIMSGGFGNIESVQYDTAHGARVNGTAVFNYVDSTTGMPISKSFLMSYDMPIVPGKYVSIAATSDKKNVEVKVNDTALALDYYKIDKSQTTSTIPYWDGTKAGTLKVTSDNVENSVAQRNANGDCYFKTVYTSALKTLSGSVTVGVESIFLAVEKPNSVIEKTSTDTGVFTETQLLNITFYKTRQIQYDNKIYYYMDPKNAPNGTLNFVHIDTVQDGNGGYKATGKCFSITVSTREWKVVDLNFGGSTNSTIKNFPVELTLTNCQVDIKDPIVIEGTKTVLSVSVNNYLYGFNTPTVSGADFYWDVTGSAGNGSGPIGTLTLFNPKASSITVEIKAVEIG